MADNAYNYPVFEFHTREFQEFSTNTPMATTWPISAKPASICNDWRPSYGAIDPWCNQIGRRRALCLMLSRQPCDRMVVMS